MILLYPENEKEFDNNGLGAISDAISCTVTEERNGLFESEIQYPVSGLHYSEIKNRSIIFGRINPHREPLRLRFLPLSHIPYYQAPFRPSNHIRPAYQL